MAVTCRAWRPSPETEHNPVHDPGSCVRCWRPCRNTVAAGHWYCDSCLALLAVHSSPKVRLWLAEDPLVPVDVVRSLAMDSDLGVASAAQRALADRGDHSLATAPPVAIGSRLDASDDPESW